MSANSELRLDAILEAHRARQLIDLLALTGNDGALADMLTALGLATSQRSIEALLDRLEAAGFIETERVEVSSTTAARVSKVTRLGRDIQTGRERCDWIQEPAAIGN